MLGEEASRIYAVGRTDNRLHHATGSRLLHHSGHHRKRRDDHADHERSGILLRLSRTRNGNAVQTVRTSGREARSVAESGRMQDEGGNVKPSEERRRRHHRLPDREEAERHRAVRIRNRLDGVGCKQRQQGTGRHDKRMVLPQPTGGGEARGKDAAVRGKRPQTRLCPDAQLQSRRNLTIRPPLPALRPP